MKIIDLKEYSCYLGRDILKNEELLHKVYSLIEGSEKVLIVRDSNVPKRMIQKITDLFPDFSIFDYEIEALEENKSLDSYEDIQNLLLANAFSRNDILVGIGGGITTDLVGFVASTYKRGMKDIYIPTTTLAMIDASIGGKCAINLGNTKNAIGSFYNPDMVIMELEFLDSLESRQFNNGLVEAIKMGLTLNKELYQCFFEENLDIERIIELSIKTKREVVLADFEDKGKREVLNFGHTIAHAIELNYSYLHGECVAYGISRNILNEELKNEVIQLFKKLYINIEEMENELKGIQFDIHNDKKVKSGVLRESYLMNLEEVIYKNQEID